MSNVLTSTIDRFLFFFGTNTYIITLQIFLQEMLIFMLIYSAAVFQYMILSFLRSSPLIGLNGNKEIILYPRSNLSNSKRLLLPFLIWFPQPTLNDHRKTLQCHNPQVGVVLCSGWRSKGKGLSKVSLGNIFFQFLGVSFLEPWFKAWGAMTQAKCRMQQEKVMTKSSWIASQGRYGWSISKVRNTI